MDLETIKYIQGVFHRADKNGGGDLDEEEFVQAFLGKLSSPDGSDQEAMRKLFYRIDANADGTVDWVRFLSSKRPCAAARCANAAAPPGHNPCPNVPPACACADIEHKSTTCLSRQYSTDINAGRILPVHAAGKAGCCSHRRK
jgi:EF hand